MNIYDSFGFTGADAQALRASSGLRMFGASNIGDTARSNMQIGCALAGDQTAVIMNWYARTNLMPANEHVLSAWSAWANAATVTVILGCSPIHQLSLADLLNRREGQMRTVVGQEHAGAESSPVVHDRCLEDLARHIYTRHPHVNTTTESAHQPPWDCAPHDVQRRTLDIARAALEFLRVPILMVIPVRQNFSVVIRPDPRAHRALLEVLPGNIAPQALVWVHLEGVMTRDVA